MKPLTNSLRFSRKLFPIFKKWVLRLDTSAHEVRYQRLLKTAARLNLALTAAKIGSSTGLLRLFSDWRANGVDGFLVMASPVLDDMRDEISELGLRYKLPGAGHQPYYVQAGVLLSYGPSLGDMHSRSAGYVDKLLKGVRPADLPVEQADRFKLVVNLKTAVTLGLTIPPTLLARADEVIE
jgi:putative ABC transport system substrate-binding protein